MINYNVSLTESEDLAMKYVATDVDEWIENAVKSRALIAIDEIVNLAVQKCMSLGIQVPLTKEETVALAYEKNWIKTAAEQMNQGNN